MFSYRLFNLFTVPFVDSTKLDCLFFSSMPAKEKEKQAMVFRTRSEENEVFRIAQLEEMLEANVLPTKGGGSFKIGD